MDQVDEIPLRLMTKVEDKDHLFAKPLSIEKYGRNIVTNIEDCSPREQKLAKFEE